VAKKLSFSIDHALSAKDARARFEAEARRRLAEQPGLAVSYSWEGDDLVFEASSPVGKVRGRAVFLDKRIDISGEIPFFAPEKLAIGIVREEMGKILS
jgi:hypothetical protein